MGIFRGDLLNCGNWLIVILNWWRCRFIVVKKVFENLELEILKILLNKGKFLFEINFESGFMWVIFLFRESVVSNFFEIKLILFFKFWIFE